MTITTPDDDRPFFSTVSTVTRCTSGARLIQSASPEVVGYDHVSDGVKNELYVICVRRARHVAVDLFGGGFVLGLELRLDISCRLSVLLGTCTKTQRLIKMFVIQVKVSKILIMDGKKNDTRIAGVGGQNVGDQAL